MLEELPLALLKLSLSCVKTLTAKACLDPAWPGHKKAPGVPARLASLLKHLVAGGVVT